MVDKIIMPDEAYKGNEPYVFISYAHKNSGEVYRIVSRLQQEGCRVWYDGGIDPGIEWAENIAAKVSGCEYFIAFITEEYINSSNCQDELSFARDKEKKRLLVYLTDTELPDGMKMRLNRLQAIHKYAYKNENEFYDKLFLADGIKSCFENKKNAAEKTTENTYTENEAFPAPDSVFTVSEPTAPDSLPAGGAAAADIPQKTGKSIAALISDRKRIIGAAAAAAVILVIILVLALSSGGSYYDLNGFEWGMTVDEAIEAGKKRNYTVAYNQIEANGVPSLVFMNVPFRNTTALALALYFSEDGLTEVAYMIQNADYDKYYKGISSDYGEPKPDYSSDDYAVWTIDDETTFELASDIENFEGCVAVGYHRPYYTYLDMRDTSWGMSSQQVANKISGTYTTLNSNNSSGIFLSYSGKEYCDETVTLQFYFENDQLWEIQYVHQDNQLYNYYYDAFCKLYGNPGTLSNGNFYWDVLNDTRFVLFISDGKCAVSVCRII